MTPRLAANLTASKLCEGCYVGTDWTAAVAVGFDGLGPEQVASQLSALETRGISVSSSGPDTALNTYIVFSTYSYLSIITNASSCVTVTADPQTLGEGFSVYQPPGVDLSSVEEAAGSLFVTNLGLPSCGLVDTAGNVILTPGAKAALPTITDTPIRLTSFASSTLQAITSTPAASSAHLSLNSISSSATASNDGNIKAAVLTRIIVPIITVVLGLTLAALFVLFRLYRRKTRRDKLPASNFLRKLSRKDPQSFVRPKAELDAEERKRYELEAIESRHELPTKDVKRQELKGEEHCRELDTHSPLATQASEGAFTLSPATGEQHSFSDLVDEIFRLVT